MISLKSKCLCAEVCINEQCGKKQERMPSYMNQVNIIQCIVFTKACAKFAVELLQENLRLLVAASWPTRSIEFVFC